MPPPSHFRRSFYQERLISCQVGPVSSSPFSHPLKHSQFLPCHHSHLLFHEIFPLGGDASIWKCWGQEVLGAGSTSLLRTGKSCASQVTVEHLRKVPPPGACAAAEVWDCDPSHSAPLSCPQCCITAPQFAF